MNPKKQPGAATLIRPLTKSRFKKANECATKLFYVDKEAYADTSRGDSFLKALAEGGFQVGELAKLYYPGGSEIVPSAYADALTQTNLLLTQKEITIYEGAFTSQNLFIRADIVTRAGDRLFLREVKAKSWSEKGSFWTKKERRIRADYLEYLEDISFQYYVVKRAYPKLEVIPSLVMADKDAVASVDGINQHFVLIKEGERARARRTPSSLEAAALGTRLLVDKEVLEEVTWLLGQPGFEERVQTFAKAYRDDVKIESEPSRACKRCEFRAEPHSAADDAKKSGVAECWGDAATNRPKAFDLWRADSDKLFKQGVRFLDQIGPDHIARKAPPTGTTRGWSPMERQLVQIEKTKKADPAPAVHAELRAALRQWTFPLHFIDFETATPALPFHKGMRPYEQIAFQFSHHTVATVDASPTHQEWIHFERGKFPNFEFVRALKAQLENDRGTVLRYSNHENTVLCQIYQQLLGTTGEGLPDRAALCAWIRTIARPSSSIDKPWADSGRMADMMDILLPFYYHPAMGGSNSIKALLPAILGPSVADPYEALPRILDGQDRNSLDAMFYDEGDELRDGGAAMAAYCRMQFSEMPDAERIATRDALLRYCKLDTLAMVMVWQAWRDL